MFRIPDYYVDTPTWESAVSTVEMQGNGDLLAGMESIEQRWNEYASGSMDMIYRDDDAFWDVWCYEVNAYNVVYEGMSQLLAPKNAQQLTH